MSIENVQRTADLLAKIGTFYIATVEGDQPRVRPFGAVTVFEDKLYIVTNNTKSVYKQMVANPKIEISGMTGGNWIRLEAEAVTDARYEARHAMLEAHKSLRNMYSEDDGIVEVLYLQNAKVTLASFTAEPESWEF